MELCSFIRLLFIQIYYIIIVEIWNCSLWSQYTIINRIPTRILIARVRFSMFLFGFSFLWNSFSFSHAFVPYYNFLCHVLWYLVPIQAYLSFLKRYLPYLVFPHKSHPIIFNQYHWMTWIILLFQLSCFKCL